MPKINVLKNNFSIGELSPTLYGRSDTPSFQNGAQTLENCYPLTGGGVVRRAGTKYIATTKTAGKAVRLIPFVYSVTTAYMLEFGHNYIRFYKEGAVVGAPYEVVTTYTETELFDLSYTQDENILYITHPDHEPAQLVYSGDTSWALSTISFIGSPPPDWQPTTSYAVDYLITYAGAVYKAASAHTSSTLPAIWQAGQSYTIGDKVKEPDPGTNYYVCTVDHTSADWDLDSANWTLTTDVGWQADFNDGKWTASTATGMPSEWTAGNYPKTVTLFEQRLVLAGSNAAPQKVWGTKSGTRNDLTLGTLDDDAYAFTLASDTVCPILWMLSTKLITLLTYSGEFTIEGGSDAALTPSNVKIANRSQFGSTFVKPMKIGNEIVFVQRAGRKLRAFAYNFANDAYDAPDLCSLASHITNSGITEMCYAQEPHTLIWAVRNDGVLVSCSYDKTQSLLGWGRHITDGLFESVATIPYGSEDQLWVVVNRDGVRSVEHFVTGINTDAASIQTSGTATATWSGISHLNGYEVDIVADGVPQPRQTITGGAVTLSRPALSVEIGLPYTSTMIDLPVEVQSAGTVQGSRVSVNEVSIRMYDTSACQINGQTVPFRRFGSGVLDQPIAPYTGDKDLHLTTGWNDHGQIMIQQTQPLSMTILGIFKKVSVND